MLDVVLLVLLGQDLVLLRTLMQITPNFLATKTTALMMRLGGGRVNSYQSNHNPSVKFILIHVLTLSHYRLKTRFSPVNICSLYACIFSFILIIGPLLYISHIAHYVSSLVHTHISFASSSSVLAHRLYRIFLPHSPACLRYLFICWSYSN